jgi:hypothetical protein
MPEIPNFFSVYPKKRPILPKPYQDIYEQEYKINRGGGSVITKASMWLEEWMHRKIARSQSSKTLEIGAGTLNHLTFEDPSKYYDIIEPFSALYKDNAAELAKIHNVFSSIDEIPIDRLYDRVISIAVLEHLEDLPLIIAKAALHLNSNGTFEAAYPSEGGVMWGLAWRFSTGIGFRLRWGLSYKPFRRFEHVNSGIEILSILQYFFKNNSTLRFPTPLHHLSFYSCTKSSAPYRERCFAYIEHVRKLKLHNVAEG